MPGVWKKRRRSVVTRAHRRYQNTSTLPPEKKFLDTYHTSSAISIATDATGGEHAPTAGSVGCISAASVGDAATNRDGKHMRIQSIEVKGTVYSPNFVNQTAGIDAISAAVFLVLDTQTNGNTINSEDVFKMINPEAAMNSIPSRNLLFGRRFKVLKAWHFNMESPQGSWDGTNMEMSGFVRTFEYFSKANIDVNYNIGTTADVANVVDNSLHIIAFQDNNLCQLAYATRIRFIG